MSIGDAGANALLAVNEMQLLLGWKLDDDEKLLFSDPLLLLPLANIFGADVFNPIGVGIAGLMNRSLVRRACQKYNFFYLKLSRRSFHTRNDSLVRKAPGKIYSWNLRVSI